MIGSLCSGYGGLDLAVEAVSGQSVAWHCENEDAPSRVLEAHWPGVPNLGDLTTVDWGSVEPVDILTAGFPCQPFSHAGRRRGEDDERHLWPYILDAIRWLRPRLVVLENVAGLRSIGGTFVEPNDRCLCGWPIGRRGLRGHEQGSAVVRSADRLRHDGEGPVGARTVATRVRRQDHLPSGSDRAVGTRREMDDGGPGRSRVPAASVALLDAETGANAPRAADRADTPRPAEPEASPEGMDAGDLRTLRHAVPADQGTEPEGADRRVGPDAGTDAVCPVCGRPVAGDADVAVFRSGFGTVLAGLAALGYDVRWASLRASDVGAPHGRERVFLVAADPDAAERGRRAAGWDDGLRAARLVEGVAADTTGDGHERGGRARHGRPGPANGRSDPAANTPPGGRPDQPVGGDPPRQHERAVAGAGGGDSARATAARVHDVGGASAVMAVAADTTGDGRHERRAEPARLIRGLDAAERGASPTTHTDGDGCESVGWVDTLRRDPDRRDHPHTAWGKYEPAIRRWERVLGRAAPPPTEPGTRGGQRLSPRFVEFLMGLPAGWVTDVDGLSRNERLRMLGNGVVPQQAEAALRTLTAVMAA